MKTIKKLLISGILALTVAFALPGCSTQQAAATSSVSTEAAAETKTESEVNDAHAQADDRAARVRAKMFSKDNLGWLILILVVSFGLTYLEQYYKNKRAQKRFK